MSLQIFALLLMVASFTLLAVWVYHPRQKARWERMAQIPLNDTQDTNPQQSGDTR